MSLPANASITDVINKLSELEGINQKEELSSVIGEPALPTDTVAQQIIKLQEAKNLLSSNLTDKGVETANTESISDMAEKVESIQSSGGAKYATGSVKSSSNTMNFNYHNNTDYGNYFTVTVTGLNFKPKMINIFLNQAAYQSDITNFYENLGPVSNYISLNRLVGDSSTSYTYGLSLSGNAYVNETSFRLPYNTSNVDVTWEAWG